jgi:hypothetical protein
MTDTNQKQLGNTLWSIADHRRDAKARSPQCPQERPDAAAFPIPGGNAMNLTPATLKTPRFEDEKPFPYFIPLRLRVFA